MWRKKIFQTWGAFCYDHAGKVILAMLAITAFFSYFAATIEINLGLLNLLEEDDELVKRVHYANENFGGMDYLFIALTTPRDRPPDKQLLIRFAKPLVERLRTHPDLVDRVVAKVDVDSLLRWAPLFLETDELKTFAEDSTKRQEDLTRVFADSRLVPFISEMNALLEREIIEEDEITDEQEALDSLKALREFYGTAWDYLLRAEQMEDGPARRSLRKLLLPTSDEDDQLDDDYFFFDDGRMLALRMMPSEPGDDYIYCEKVMRMVQAEVAAVSRDAPGVEVLLAGNIHVMQDEHLAMVRDMKMTTFLSLLLVLLLFGLIFRRFSDLLLITVCLLAGISITFGLTAFAIGYLSLLTAFFGAIMIGLGIDFAIHLASRYNESIQAGRPVRESIIEALVGAGPGMLTGGVTTSCAFLVLMIARFKGLSQLGFVSGVGILVMLILMFTLLPALVVLRDRRKKLSSLGGASMGESIPLAWVADFAMNHPRTGGLIISTLVVLAILGALQTTFNYDYRSLEPRGSLAIKHLELVEERIGRSNDYGMFITDSVAASRLIEQKVKQLPTVRETESISEFIPENQDEKNEILKSLAPIFEPIVVRKGPTPNDAFTAESLGDLAAAASGSARVVRAVLQLAILGGQFEIEDLAREVEREIRLFADNLAAQASSGMATNGTRYQQIIGDELAFLLKSLKLSTLGQTMTVEHLPEEIASNFIGKDGKMVVYAYPTQNIWNEKFMIHHNAELRRADPQAISIGILFEEIVFNIKEDFKSSVWFSLAAVFLLVLIDFRRLRTTLLAMVPLLTGSILMVGIMPLIGMQFNLINVAIVPLILGIGIDNGVHIIHRYRMEKEKRVHRAVEHTGRAILLSSLTTMAGFGMLGLASYVAIGTLGQLLVLGVGFCFLTSISVLPMILGVFERRGWKV